MTDTIITILLWVCALGSGLMAGIYFAFSTFLMTAFARIPQAHGISAMQSINTTIVKSLFLPLFFGTTLIGLFLAGWALYQWDRPGATLMLAGGLIYALCMFASTIVFNVPLNNALAAMDGASAEATAVWNRYLKEWVFWNHVRTVASLVACGLFIAAIAA
ncbi:MAG: anthrone oxygenase family protein [Alphaproteobacteria bacterium]|nr:anthrone oxygenase family protein [Alphaproteobacteria bacterium]